MRTITLASVLLLAHAIACAQTSYPVKPVRIIVPSAPGGGSDITTRALNQRFHEYLGQPFVVENRGGAATVIGTELAARGAPDGYTLLNEAVVRAIREPAIRKRFADDGVDAVGSTPEEFAKLIRDDIAKWHRVVKQAGIKQE